MRPAGNWLIDPRIIAALTELFADFEQTAMEAEQYACMGACSWCRDYRQGTEPERLETCHGSLCGRGSLANRLETCFGSLRVRETKQIVYGHVCGIQGGGESQKHVEQKRILTAETKRTSLDKRQLCDNIFYN